MNAELHHSAGRHLEVGGLRVCSSILLWRSCGAKTHGSVPTAAKTADAVAAIEAATPTIWGGDWNYALLGREWTGSQKGRRCILDTVSRLGLQVPTATSPHRIESLLTDHDAYVIQVSR